MNYGNLKRRLDGVKRELEMELLAENGPQHGKAGIHRSKRDKMNDPKTQRKTRSWERDE